MNRIPRNPDELFFGWRKLLLALVKGFFTSRNGGSIFLDSKEGHSDNAVRAYRIFLH